MSALAILQRPIYTHARSTSRGIIRCKQQTFCSTPRSLPPFACPRYGEQVNNLNCYNNSAVSPSPSLFVWYGVYEKESIVSIHRVIQFVYDVKTVTAEDFFRWRYSFVRRPTPRNDSIAKEARRSSETTPNDRTRSRPRWPRRHCLSTRCYNATREND